MPSASATSSSQSGPQNWTSGQHNQSYQPSQFFNQTSWSDLKIKNEKFDEADNEADNEAKTNPKPEQSMQAMGHLAYLPGEKFDPSTTSFSHDELRPAPIIPKRKKVTWLCNPRLSGFKNRARGIRKTLKRPKTMSKLNFRNLKLKSHEEYLICRAYFVW